MSTPSQAIAPKIETPRLAIRQDGAFLFLLEGKILQTGEWRSIADEPASEEIGLFSKQYVSSVLAWFMYNEE
jgi:hypothetical protein